MEFRASRFPPARDAPASGLVRIGGQLTPDWLIDAYSHGIFPWPVVEGRREVLAWFSPDPRAIMPLDGVHVSRRLARRLRRGEFTWTLDQEFSAVVHHCADRGGRATWITPSMERAYTELHRRGIAHSIEVRHDGVLVGGLYGIALGGYFAGESMFHRRRDASKAALVLLAEHLRQQGFRLFDVQLPTPHLERLGAVTISRDEFLRRLPEALRSEAQF